MNTIKSILFGSLIRVSSLHNMKRPSLISTVSHIALCGTGDNFDTLTYKELKKLVTSKKIKGRSKLTTKVKMIAALRLTQK